MELKIPKIVRPLRLEDYASEMSGTELQVWVNPPQALITRWDDVMLKRNDSAERAQDMLRACDEIMSELWSQGSEPVTAEDIGRLRKETEDTDPGLVTWLMQHTWQMIYEHRLQRKKA